MADNRRNTSVLLLVLALMGLVIFYGCGGGSSSDPLPTGAIKTYQVTGRVSSTEAIASLLDSSAAIRAATNMGGIEVYLETNRAMYNTRTASDGTFLLPVPLGTHNIIALVPSGSSLTGKVYKARSVTVTVTESKPTVEVSTLNLKPAEAVLTGTVKDTAGNPITNARIIVWGEEVMVDAQGKFQILMPDNTNAPVSVTGSGMQESTFNVAFDNDNPQFIEQTLVNTAATNRAPVASLSATIYQISVGSKVSLTGSAFDPDGDALNISFSTSSGTVEQLSANSTSARFSAAGNVIATVTMTAEDPAGLRAKANIRIQVGTGGVVASNSAPVLTDISANSTSFGSGQTYQLTAEVTDADQDVLYYIWHINSGLGTLVPTNQKMTTWTVPQLSATSTASITVIVTDGKSSAVSRHENFTLSPDPALIGNLPPTIQIVSPTNNQLFISGQSISFVASATDPNTPLSYKWEIDGVQVSSQQSFARSVSATGSHNVTLTVADKFQASNSITQTFRINNKPVAQISGPANGTLYQASATVTFTGSATDVEDGAIATNRLVWTFPDNSMQTGSSVSFNKFAYGTSTVKLSAYDSKSEWAATQSRQIYTNNPPKITKILPASGTVAQLGSNITFQGTASDADSFQTLTYNWSSGSTVLGTTNPLVRTLPAGIYNITLTVNDGTTGTGNSVSSYSRLVVNQPPVMNITAPTNNSVIPLNKVITFNGNGLSTQGVTVKAATMLWEDTHKGNTTALNNGVNTFTKTYTQVTELGTHTIRLIGADEYNIVGSTTINFFVNATPTVTLDTPASGTRFDTGSSIAFKASPSDPDTAEILTVNWYDGNSPTAFGSGSTLNYAGLAHGYHSIFCRAIDSSGYYSVASTGVLINTLPTATVTISSAVPQYATAPANVPVFMSTTTSMNLTLGISAIDVEDGVIPGTSIGWFVWDGVEYDHIATTSTSFNHVFGVGSNTIKIEIYDSYFAKGFPATQTRAIILKPLHVWQAITYPNTYLSLTSSPVYIEGNSQVVGPKLYITDNAAKQVKEVIWDGNRAINQLETDYLNYTPAVVATYPLAFSAVKCGLPFANGMALLGTDGTDKIYAFVATDTGDALPNNPLAAAAASSIAFNSKIPAQRLAYATLNSSSKVIAFDSETGALSIPTLELTTANGTALGNNLRVRFNSQLPSGYGNLFVADTVNNRIIMTFSDFSGAISLSADSPKDVAFSKSYLFSLNSTTNEITLIDPTKSPIQRMKFGSTVEFTNPVGIFCSGFDLFVLESTGELKVIRSGMSNWLDGQRLW